MTAQPFEIESFPWPAPPTPLLGRGNEIASLCALIAEDETRLVTVTGPGGVGKTRLVLAVMDELSREGDTAIVFVPVEQVRDQAALIGAIAEALGVREAGSTPLIEVVAGALAQRMPLLVLDNLEQVAAGAARIVARLLALEPGLTVLATSRISLAIRGERLFVLEPLPLPAPDDDATAESPAITLFAERAKAVRPDFMLTPEVRQVVARICRRLDGLPLAIELAAARSRLLSPDALLARLEQRLTVLGGGLSDLPERQQTLQGAIGWSYELLPDDQRRVFRRLAAIPAEFTPELAAAVAETTGEEALTAIDSLLGQSLLVNRTGGGSELRFGMLQTIRDFGLEQAIAAGELERGRELLAAYVHARRAEIRAGLEGADARGWRAWCSRERSNILAAIDWCVRHADATRAVEITGAVWRFWYIEGLYREGISALERALALPQIASPHELGNAYNGLGALHFGLDEDAPAAIAFDHAAEQWELAGNTPGLANAIHNRALLARERGEYTAAIAGFERAIALMGDLIDTRRLAIAEDNLGLVYETLGEHERAADLHARSVASSRASGDDAALATSMHHLASSLLSMGDIAGASARAEEARAIWERLGGRSQLAYCLNTLGILAEKRGDAAEAEQRYGEALSLWRELEERRGISLALHNLASIAAERGDLTEGAALLRESLAIRRTSGNPRDIAYSVRGFAGIALAADDPVRAVRLSAFAHRLAEEHGFAVDEEESRAKLRRSLGRSRHDAEWKAGEAMSLDNALGEIEMITVPDQAVITTRVVEGAAPAALATVEDHGLTPRELDVLREIASGKTNAEIGEALFISPFTAKTHVANLLGKLGVESRAAASTWAAQRGLA